MTDRHEIEQSLLTEVTRRLAEISETQHELARRQRILLRAATQLRTGKRAESVLAEIREQSPELLRDYCDLHISLTPTLRPVPRVAASAARAGGVGGAAAIRPTGPGPVPTPGGSASA
jgi:hypothetical protein